MFIRENLDENNLHHTKILCFYWDSNCYMIGCYTNSIYRWFHIDKQRTTFQNNFHFFSALVRHLKNKYKLESGAFKGHITWIFALRKLQKALDWWNHPKKSLVGWALNKIRFNWSILNCNSQLGNTKRGAESYIRKRDSKVWWHVFPRRRNQ